MLFIVAIIHVSLIPDKNATQQSSICVSSAPPISKEIGTADELRKYKELLDEGVISQSEFEEKKRQLLHQ